jgi:hypothetical protein
MSQIIESLFHGMRDYVKNYTIASNPKTGELHIFFVYNSYDLIDADLDFDEAYYERIISNIQSVLVKEVRVLIAAETFVTARIICARCVMRASDNIVEMEVIVSNDSVSTTTF